MKVTAYNPSTDNLEMSYLSNSYSVGVTTIVVRDTDRFDVNDRILLGSMGFEQSEVVTVSAVNADKMTLTVSATSFPHAASDPVFVLKYDQIRFYRSITTVDGSYSVVDTVDLDVDNSSGTTSYDDPTGLTSYYYKTTYFNSVSSLESDFSDPIAGQGYARNQAGAIINEFLEGVSDLDQTYMTVTQALNLMNECNDDLSTQSSRPYRTLKTSATLDIAAGNSRVALPTDLMAIQRIKFESVQGVYDRTDNIEIIDMEEMEYLSYDNTAVHSDDLIKIAIDESTNELVLYPTPFTTQSGRIKIYYWKKFSDFDGLSSTIELPTPRVYKLFLTSRFYRSRALHDASFMQLADRWQSDYGSEVVKLQRINRLDRGTQRGMRPDTHLARQLRKY